MSTLKPRDLFLMQRDGQVLSFNGEDFKELVLDAGSVQFDLLQEQINTINLKTTDFELRITDNTTKIELLIEAINTLQKTAVTTKLNANPCWLSSVGDIPRSDDDDDKRDMKEGTFSMSKEFVDNKPVDAFKFEEAKILYISATDSAFGNANAPIEYNLEWNNLTPHDPADPESGDYIQIININTEGTGLFRITSIDEVKKNDVITLFEIGVEYVKGNLDGTIYHQYDSMGNLSTTHERSQVVIQGIQTKIGLNIDDADNRYLVKKDGGNVEEVTHFWKQLTVGRNIVNSTHDDTDQNKQGDILLKVITAMDPLDPVDDPLDPTDATKAKIKFEVRSSGEIYSADDYKPFLDDHIPNVKYIKGKYLTEDGNSSTISANARYLRIDGANKMKTAVQIEGTANGDIITLGNLGETAKFNCTSNNLDVVFNASSYKMNVGSSNASSQIKIDSGKVTLGSTHVSYISTNYNSENTNNYVATIGVMKTAISNANLPTTGSGSVAGIVKLSDSITSSLNVNNGTSATPYAVKKVNDKIYPGMQVAGTSCDAGGFKESNGNLIYRTLR